MIYRQTNLKIFSWIKTFGIQDHIIRLRIFFKENDISEFYIYNLPNGLWIISLTTLLLVIWENNYKKEFWVYFLILFSLVVFPEIFQLFHLISGTYDGVDLIVNLLCFGIPCTVVLLHNLK